MKKILLLLAFIPIIGNAQVDLSKFHDENKLWDLVDSIYSDLIAVFNWEDKTINLVRHVYFELEQGGDLEEGQMAWDSIDKTISVGLDAGSALQIGQEVHMRATNKTGATIPDGRAVYVSGSIGSRPTIVPATDTSITAILTLGVTTQAIENNKTGYVTIIGLVRGVDTRVFSPGDVLWLGEEPGILTNVRPEAPSHAVTLGVPLNSLEEGLLAIRPTAVQRLAWLSDVDARDEQTNWDMLRWMGDSLKWKPTGGLLNLPSIPTYADNTAALAGGLVAGDVYKTATGELMIVY
jgi:hypothetical protein